MGADPRDDVLRDEVRDARRGERDRRRERRSVVEPEDDGDRENRRERHPGKRVDDLAPLLESGGHGPRDADESVVWLGDVLRGVPVGELVLISQRQLRVHHEERDRRCPALARAREEAERVRDGEGELDSREIRVIPQRDVRGPFDDACLGRRRQAVRVALDDSDLARERDREEPLCVRGRVEGVRVVRKQARRREASRVFQARKEHPGADGRSDPAGQDHQAQTDDRPCERPGERGAPHAFRPSALRRRSERKGA